MIAVYCVILAHAVSHTRDIDLVIVRLRVPDFSDGSWVRVDDPRMRSDGSNTLPDLVLRPAASGRLLQHRQ